MEIKHTAVQTKKGIHAKRSIVAGIVIVCVLAAMFWYVYASFGIASNSNHPAYISTIPATQRVFNKAEDMPINASGELLKIARFVALETPSLPRGLFSEKSQWAIPSPQVPATQLVGTVDVNTISNIFWSIPIIRQIDDTKNDSHLLGRSVSLYQLCTDDAEFSLWLHFKADHDAIAGYLRPNMTGNFASLGVQIVSASVQRVETPDRTYISGAIVLHAATRSGVFQKISDETRTIEFKLYSNGVCVVAASSE